MSLKLEERKVTLPTQVNLYAVYWSPPISQGKWCAYHLDDKNSQFYEFCRAFSARIAELTSQGIETTTKQAEPINEDTERIIWDKELLGDKTCKSMLNAMFFYNNKLFGLRGVDEHRNLSKNKFKLGSDQNGQYIMFMERANKTIF